MGGRWRGLLIRGVGRHVEVGSHERHPPRVHPQDRHALLRPERFDVYLLLASAAGEGAGTCCCRTCAPSSSPRSWRRASGLRRRPWRPPDSIEGSRSHGRRRSGRAPSCGPRPRRASAAVTVFTTRTTGLTRQLLATTTCGIDRPANLRPPDLGWGGSGSSSPDRPKVRWAFAEPMERGEGCLR
jgi:hypothetical protein